MLFHRRTTNILRGRNSAHRMSRGGVTSCGDILWFLVVAFMYSESGTLHVSGGVYGGSSGGGGYNALPESGTQSPTNNNGILGGPDTSSGGMSPSRYDPYFDALTPRNVTALVGKSAYLSCRVRNLGNKTVSWIRHRDIHILTVGGYTYTSDQRFQANHHRETDEWTLQIKWAQKRDAGVYECQISTQPVRSYFVNLNVVDELSTQAEAPEANITDTLKSKPPRPKRPLFWDDKYYENPFYIYQRIHRVPTAIILGGPDLHVDKGSTINLTCTIRFSPEPPAYIFWYHQDEVISYDSTRGGVSVITEKGEITTSFLLIQHADLSDSGKYSCSPSNAEVATVRVHVLNGERPAAMQTGSAGLSNSSLNILALIIILYFYTNVYKHLQLSSIEHFR
ncbi:myosin light chain kinase, smooth muscle-like isoform X1 [Chrysoperla carnea]|uniref:myosin light chain kinase, smooth muscle-like isoform X1 n=1 Tax=Chrysoperla carnea TaxID=189513 RepID=UPI001D0847E1|nr:myosin light chain kinase, smooth muscle-like isoform X1 [Chrysoperla carnea]XP_044740801.1 myosin light chain kinase, smooth muscle-like isoform X1 [Chrysoperla carnea]